MALAIGLLGAMPEARAEAAGLPQAERQQALVNINTATAEQLTTLPGVGPATAARIIEYREKNGGFKKIEDLMNVRGIGEKTFLRLKPLVTITPPKLHVRPL
ncbi:MAG TPA: helix-hairpin-helix domain-containing protein [Vicinamibacterales bacterium]|nr:helix-hairpin-helix domain-containing protein [Vicinamibacterales bacterium]